MGLSVRKGRGSFQGVKWESHEDDALRMEEDV